ncbi:hypothetical protein RD055328_12810 [Companilactobacillus sp. RD055328]|uniref:YveK family protein n=1 Tax=Companilactobacillus sp. RD055328 TaxID=2916634 RepID=UPI001FC85955|nr:Wzz/FepE/Etk N-terminal domain-containing protein [Companilactobacillus sp. RD055328]GKQ43358.1 hypothetical protein RD055328_12810 [Companilactobacillus sp. RD055328]
MINSENLTIKKFIKNLRNSVTLLIVFFVLILGTTYVYGTFVSKDTYSSDMRVLVNMKNEKNSAVQSEDMKTNIQLMNTYSEVIKSNQMMTKINKKLKLPHSKLKEIESNLNVSSDNNSLIIKVNYSDTNKELVSKVMKVLSQEIKTELPRLFPNIEVSILAKPDTPTKDSVLIKYILDIVVWFVISVSYLLLVTLRDQQIDSPEELNKLGVRYLGRVKNKFVVRW